MKPSELLGTKCRSCKALMTDTTYSNCPKCRARMREYERARTARLKAEHRCLTCGTPLPKGYIYVRCERCLAKQNEVNRAMNPIYNKHMYDQRKRDGVCTSCGKRKVDRRKTTLCAYCKKKLRKKTKNMYWRRKAANQCTRCGTSMSQFMKPENGKTPTVCPSCKERIEQNKKRRMEVQK